MPFQTHSWSSYDLELSASSCLNVYLYQPWHFPPSPQDPLFPAGLPTHLAPSSCTSISSDHCVRLQTIFTYLLTYLVPGAFLALPPCGEGQWETRGLQRGPVTRKILLDMCSNMHVLAEKQHIITKFFFIPDIQLYSTDISFREGLVGGTSLIGEGSMAPFGPLRIAPV